MEDSKPYSKQDIAREYTRICQEVFGVGVKRIKIDLYPGVIVILTEQSQSALIGILGQEGYAPLAAKVGGTMGDIFRRRLLDVCQTRLGIPVKRLFRDYQDGVTLTYIQLEEGA